MAKSTVIVDGEEVLGRQKADREWISERVDEVMADD